MPRFSYERLSLDAAEAEIGGLYASAECSTPYCHPIVVRVLAQAFGREGGYCVACSGSRPVAAIPYLRRAFGPVHICEALPFDCYALPLVDPALTPKERYEVYDRLYRELRRSGTVVRCLPPEWLDPQAVTAFAGRAVTARSYEIYIKHLAGLADDHALLDSYRPHHRKQVLIARKAGLFVERSQSRKDFEDFFVILEETMRRVSRHAKFPYSAVVDGGLAIIKAGLGTFQFVRQEGKICAGAFFLSSNSVTHYWLAATTSDKKQLKHYPMFAIMHAAMMDSAKRRIAVFELGATPTAGLREFKAKWGAEPVSQPTYTFGNRLAVAALNLRRRVDA